MTPRGCLLYEGPSNLDGSRIFVAVTHLRQGSRNDKIGDMAQAWILPWEEPRTAIPEGRDVGVCGDCKHRVSAGGACYVTWRWGPQQVWCTHRVLGSYPAAEPGWFDGRPVRFGAFGDPAAVPLRVWRPMLDLVPAWTGYTHQWRRLDPAEWGWLMASVDSETEHDEAKAAGWRTFRVRGAEQPLLTREIACPASEEAGKRTTCARCRLCNGVRAGAVRDISIVVHGQRAARFDDGAQVLEVVRRAAGEPRPAVHTGMSWHDIRRQWNAEGQCARQACRAELPDPAPVHRDSGLLYCHACKRLINRTNGMVLVAVPGATP